MPCLSVCIPTYNGAAYLSQAIDSVLAQTFTDFELIIVDDGSTDDSAAVARSFADSRLRVYQNDHRLGLVGNWNRCLELAQGDFICLFHQDDVMLPDNLAAKVDALRRNPTVGLVYSEVKLIDGAGQVTAGHWYFPTGSAPNPRPGRAYFQQLIAAENLVCCPSVVARQSCYQQLGSFNASLPFTADWEMWLRIALFFDVYYLPHPLLHYRLHPDNESHRFGGVADLKHGYLAKMEVLAAHAPQIENLADLQQQIGQYYAAAAFKHAWTYYNRRQMAQARPFLEFAIQLQTATNPDDWQQASPARLAALFEEIWFARIEALWQAESPTEQPAIKNLLDNLSAQDLALNVPFRKMVEAALGKAWAKRGWRWLQKLVPSQK